MREVSLDVRSNAEARLTQCDCGMQVCVCIVEKLLAGRVEQNL